MHNNRRHKILGEFYNPIEIQKHTKRQRRVNRSLCEWEGGVECGPW